MKKLGKLSRLALALLAGGPALARAQVPAFPAAPAAAVPAAAVPATGVAAVPATGVVAAPQRNLWSFLCPNEVQTAKLKACFCGSQFGQLINNSMSVPSVFTGGVIPQCCPILDPADLLLPPDSAQGAAAQVKKDTLAAAKRRAAIRYISTADCNWWPEVQAALANTLRMDRNECVRLEAALALQRGCCCNPTTVRALVQALSPLPTDGNPPEDSPRVRAAAMVALDHCLHCYYGLAAAPPCPTPVPVPAPEELPKPRKEGPPPELPPPPPPPPPPGKVPVVRAEPPLRPVSATGPARDASMDQLIQEARLVLQKAKERQEAAIRAAAAKPQSLTELLEETFHSSATKAAPVAVGQQKPTPPPTIFGPPARTQTVDKPSPAPTTSVAGAPRSVVAPPTAPKGNPSLAPVAASSVPPTLTPTPAAPQHYKAAPDVAVKSAPPTLKPTPVAPLVPSVAPSSATPTPPVSASPAPLPIVPSVVPTSTTPTLPVSASEVRKETFHSSTTPAAPLAVGQQKPTPPPTIFSPPARTQTVDKPSPAPTTSVAGAPRSVIAPPTAPKGNPSLAPVAANSAPPTLTPTPAAPQHYKAAPDVAVKSAPPTLTPIPVAPVVQSVAPSSAAPTPPVSASPAPIRPPTLAEVASGAKTQPEKAPLLVQQIAAKTQPEKAPVLIQQTAATSASPQTLSAWQLLLLLRNSSHDDIRAHAASSLAGHEKPTPAVVQALVSSAGADASSEVRLACLKTLLKLRVNDPALPFTLMRLQTDQDSRVRDAAKALHQQLQSRADAPTPPRS